MRNILHISTNVDICAGYLRRPEKDVPTVATSTVDPDRVFAAVGGRAVEGDFTALVAIDGVCGPCCLIPSVFKVVRHLCQAEWQECNRKKGKTVEHL